MDRIILDRDYQLAKTIIQNNIDDNYIAEEYKLKLIALYNAITIDNGRDIYMKASSLIYEASMAEKLKFDNKMFKYAGIGIIGGGIFAGICWLGHKYTGHKIFKNLLVPSCVVTGLSFILLLSIGH